VTGLPRTVRPMSDRGQASIETVALLPVVIVLAVAAWQGILIGWTALEAESAARAGVRALQGGEEAGPAIGASLPASMRQGLRIERAGERLTVQVAVPSVVPGLGMRLAASAAVVER
jgi:TadE-like protein